ncbi:MAG: YiiD C-terminal domain-containing protein [Deltaproteobacteria bacterium]|nr:YiiD C-terminal domain-containing protein [Deltaproteobacteria bacterium]MBW2445537.1 YiiD C-terminal domain-containing protein [Deltaproteobacteria bacterium]
MSATLATIPYTDGLGLTLDRVADGEVQMTLPDGKANRNLAGTVHAGLLYTFGETLAGVAAGLETLEKAFPFARRGEIRYRRPARGAVHGTARVTADEIHRVLDELAREGRSELTVHARLAGDDGETVAEMDVDYAFRPLERT